MSLITQCPACSTMFKVVPDQLRISDGWVRCGQCDEVFDANAHLRALPDSLPAAASPPPPSEPVPTAVTAPALAPVEDYDWGPVTGVTPPEAPAIPEADPLEDYAISSVDTPADIAPEALAGDPFLECSPQELSAFSESTPPDEFDPTVFEESPGATDEADPAGAREPMLDATPQPAAPIHPSFLKPAREPSRWQSPWARGLGVLGCGVLTLALLAQVLVHERDQIAARQPGLQDALSAMCTLLECKVGALKNIDAVVIDSSSFAKAGNHLYKLQFTLKNAGGLVVATPAVELSLTDTQDKVVLRRVVRASELGGKQLSIPAGEEVSSTLALQINPANGADPVTGYRLFAFYP